jgi:hypothetical protein
VEVANLLDAPHGFLRFQPVHGGLDSRVGWPMFFRKSFLNVANGGLSLSSELLHDLQFQLG